MTMETFDALRERIRDKHDQLSPHLQRIARTALNEPNQLALQTIAVIAKKAEVQPSTLIRFAKEFGYEGFSSLQHIFRMRLIEGAPVYREQVLDQHGSGAEDQNASESLNRSIDDHIASLEQVRRDIRQEDVNQAVNILHEAEHIYVAGLRRARPISTYFSYGMNRLERSCSVLDFGGGMAGQQIINMGQNDILVAVAFTPYATPVVDVVKDAFLRGRKIIALTDTSTSPLSQNSTVSFLVDGLASGPFRPISGAIGLAQALIVGLGAKQ